MIYSNFNIQYTCIHAFPPRSTYFLQDPKIANWMLDPGAKEQSLHRMVHNRLPLEAFLLEGKI